VIVVRAFQVHKVVDVRLKLVKYSKLNRCCLPAEKDTPVGMESITAWCIYIY